MNGLAGGFASRAQQVIGYLRLRVGGFWGLRVQGLGCGSLGFRGLSSKVYG